MKQSSIPILIYDSELSRCAALEGALSSLGFNNTHKVRNYKSIEPALKSKGIQLLIIADLESEDETQKVLKSLLKDKETKDIPKVLYTSSRNPTFLRTLIGLGINGVIKNPLELNSLRQVMRNYLRVRQSKDISKKVRDAQIFKDFSDDEIKTLVKSTFLRRFPAGETIIEKGAPSDHFYILIEGKVEVLLTRTNRNNIRFIVDEGNPFGEMAVLTKSPRSAWCIAADDCVVLEVGSQLINDTHDVIRLKLMTNLAYLLAMRVDNLNHTIEEFETQVQLYEPCAVKAEPVHTKEPVSHASPPKVEISEEINEQKEAQEAPTEQAEVVDAPTPEAYKVDTKESSDEPTGDPITEASEEAEESEEDDEVLGKSPFSTPTGAAETYNEQIKTQEEYDILHRKINLRSDFITAKIPNPLVDKICKRMYSYWIGSKLSKHNPHFLWNEKSFTSGTFRLNKALHLVVCCRDGNQAFHDCFLQLPLTQRVVGLSQVGCVGTFLGTMDAINRYVEGEILEEAIELDMEIPIDRKWRGKDCIEYLTHTPADVRDETLFLVIDEKDGEVTNKIRSRFPKNQMITVVKGISFKTSDPATIFTYPEEYLRENNLYTSLKEFEGYGFYAGETVFLPDFTMFCEEADALKEWGFLFATIGILAKIGPDYSGITWGSQGGAEGAVKAARAMFGLKGAQSSDDLSRAISWADN